jgi:predicted metal-binding membrane protein
MFAPLRELPPRDRIAILGALGGLAAIGWLYTWQQADAMNGMADMAMPAGFTPWTAEDLALNLLIWWVMMIGMMLPSATPMILVFAAINRRKRERAEPFVPTAVFTAGYLVVWGLFGFAATAAEWGLEQAALISPESQRVGPLFAAGIVAAAGLYQLTPLKTACLAHCRSPFEFILTHWKTGTRGAFRMGVEHGFFCLGCCWVLMALLFAGGVMSLVWMAALAVFVLVEKVLPAGRWVARASGVAMLGYSAYLFARA